MLVTLLGLPLAAVAQVLPLREADLTRDPQWEAFRNRLLPDKTRVTRQDFGWRDGRIGGWIQRSLTPASYSRPVAPRTFETPMRVSGKFSVHKDHGGTGVLFGWFHESSRGWRTPNSLAFRLDGNGGKYWVFYEYGTRNGRAGGGGCFEGERYQTTRTKPFLADGTEHAWQLAYEPRPGGDGLVTFTLDGTAHSIVMPAAHRAEGAEFNRFGVWNQQTSGDGMEAWFTELALDGKQLDLGRDTGWSGKGNRAEFNDRAMRPFHDFGWAATNRLGGKGGEIGGVIWRDERPAHFADHIGPLSLRDELLASGRFKMHVAGSDSGMMFGWFDSASKTNKSTPEHSDPQRNYLAVLVEGPSRVGHYFRPAWSTSTGARFLADSGAIIKADGKSHRWSLHYKPDAAGGRGEVTVKFDDATQSIALPADHKESGARFDRFGVFNVQSGGHHIDFSLDELRYTARSK